MKKIIVILALIVIVLPLLIYAQIIPIGGRILATDRCSCSGNIIILYLPVRSFMPKLLSCRDGASKVYSYALTCQTHSLRTGQQILGITIAPDVCLTGSHCRPHDLQLFFGLPKLVRLLGTSR